MSEQRAGTLREAEAGGESAVVAARRPLRRNAAFQFIWAGQTASTLGTSVADVAYPLAILAQAATFLVLFFVIKKFALDGIVSTLEKRRKTIDDGVRLGREISAQLVPALVEPADFLP